MSKISLRVSTVKPLGERVLLKVSESVEQTSGGIFLPDTAKEKPQIGSVVAIGSGKQNEDGSRQPIDLQVGERVLYSKYAGTEIKLGDEDYVLLGEKDILATLA